MKLAQFAKWAVTTAFEGGDVSGFDIQDKAVELGILNRTQYDPDKHGENDVDADPGDERFVYSDEFKYVLNK